MFCHGTVYFKTINYSVCLALPVHSPSKNVRPPKVTFCKYLNKMLSVFFQNNS